MGSIITALLGIVKAIPILDSWIKLASETISNLLKKYRDYKDAKRKAEIEEAKRKAKQERNTDDLRKEMGKLL